MIFRMSINSLVPIRECGVQIEMKPKKSPFDLSVIEKTVPLNKHPGVSVWGCRDQIWLRLEGDGRLVGAINHARPDEVCLIAVWLIRIADLFQAHLLINGRHAFNAFQIISFYQGEA